MCLNVALDDLIPRGQLYEVQSVGDQEEVATPIELWGFGSYPYLWNTPHKVDIVRIQSSQSGAESSSTGAGTPPANTDPSLFRRSVPPMSLVERSAYKILLRIRECIGWDALVDIRMALYGTSEDHLIESTLNVSGISDTLFENSSSIGGISGRIGSPICSFRLNTLFKLLRDDLESMMALKKEIKDGIVETKLSPASLGRRINACMRFQKFEYLEILSCAFTDTRNCFDPALSITLLRGYMKRDQMEKAMSVLINLWLNIEPSLFPVGKRFSLPPWLGPSVRNHSYRTYDHCPVWLHRVVVDVSRRWGSDSVRRYVQGDTRLVLLDQLLAHIQITVTH
jgi:hypothetical protein